MLLVRIHLLIYVQLEILNTNILMSIHSIKPGPKSKKDNGSEDKRRRVLPENKPKHPGLKTHKHKPGDAKK